MTVVNYPSRMQFLLAEAGTILRLGSFTLPRAYEIAHVELTLTKVGTRGGTERCRVLVYPTSDYDDAAPAIHTSAWVDLDDVDADLELTSADEWLARPVFAFTLGHLMGETAYYLGLETENYAPTLADYLGVKTDWPDQVNTGDTTAAQMRFFGYRGGTVPRIKMLEYVAGVEVAGEPTRAGVDTTVAFNGSESSKAVDVSSLCEDATLLNWILKKPSTNEQIPALTYTATTTTVTVATDSDFPLPNGTYLLVGA